MFIDGYLDKNSKVFTKNGALYYTVKKKKKKKKRLNESFMGQINQFKNHLYLMGLYAKKKTS